MNKCLVCGGDRWLTLDVTTGFTFCDEHYRTAKDVFYTAREKTLAEWLRAIARVIDIHALKSKEKPVRMDEEESLKNQVPQTEDAF